MDLSLIIHLYISRDSSVDLLWGETHQLSKKNCPGIF